jgi:hypothetical protein
MEKEFQNKYHSPSKLFTNETVVQNRPGNTFVLLISHPNSRILHPNPCITLTAPEDSLYQYQSTSVYNSTTTIVHFEDIRDHISSHLLSFQIPGTYTNLTVEPRVVESTDSVHYTWSGPANESGFFSITNLENLYSGFIQTDSGAWTILPLREHYSLLLRHNPAALDTVDCVMEEGESAAEPPDYCSEAYNTCPAVIDVLLFFTDEAVAMVPGTRNLP